MTRASDLARLIGAGATINDGTTITTADNTEQLSLVSTDADASVGPVLRMDRQSASAADGDLLGKVNFVGHNDAGTPEDISYASITGIINDASDGTEDGKIAINTIVAGTEKSRIFIDKGETVFNEESADLDFRVEGNGNTHAIFMQGGTDKVGIGQSAPNDFGTTASNLVVGTTTGDNGLTIVSATNAGGRIQFADNTSSPFRGAFEYNHAADEFIFYTNGTDQLKINSSGIITNGSTASNTTSASANMVVTSGGEFAKSTSSKRYKNTINDAKHGLTELLKLRSVTFKGNKDGDTIFGGLIAEEVHDAGLTEFVQYDDEDKPESLHYTHMIALCVKAIQELEARIATLESK
tara:strand:+ start:133 stop:1191 length:1059 start_codon:yes stop_codon:yes gene_type:complete